MFDIKLKERWLTEQAKQKGIDELILELLLRHSRAENELERAIANTLQNAISRNITWHDTPEGSDFWYSLYMGKGVRAEISNSPISLTANVLFIDFKEFE